MTTLPLGDVAVFNPAVKLARGTVAPYVGMESVTPFTRDVFSSETKPYSGGAKFLDGDILMARITPSLENGKTSIYRASDPAYSAAFGSTEFIVVRGAPGKTRTDFLYYLLTAPDIRDVAIASMTGSSGRQRVQTDVLMAYEVEVPSLAEQRAIAATLGMLDDKIESNRHQRSLCRQLGQALVAKLEVTATECAPLENFALSISRGVTPKYYKDEDVEPVMVLNQRCIRDGWVSPNVARLMLPRLKAKDTGIAEQGDLLVNSTGQGTLGRVGRWSYEDALYVDSHVTVVKPDQTQIAPTLLSYLVFPRQPEIKDMAEGSTGQTELSPNRLGSLELPIVPRAEQELIEPQLLVLEEKGHAAALETTKLEALRDTLLPELMLGRIRVPEAREAIDQEVGL